MFYFYNLVYELIELCLFFSVCFPFVSKKKKKLKFLTLSVGFGRKKKQEGTLGNKSKKKK